MQKLFHWLSPVFFCVVLIAIPIGIFELLYLSEPKATFIGCRVGDYAIYCDDRPLKYVKEIILNLPLGLLLAAYGCSIICHTQSTQFMVDRSNSDLFVFAQSRSHPDDHSH